MTKTNISPTCFRIFSFAALGAFFVFPQACSDDSTGKATCTEQAGRCLEGRLERCVGGSWEMEEDCAAQSMVCEEGAGPNGQPACVVSEGCTDGDTRCEEGRVEECLDGAWEVWEDCGFLGLVCEEGAGAGGEAVCVDPSGDCIEETWRCEGDRVEHCVEGAWEVEEDCASQSMVCQEGAGLNGEPGCVSQQVDPPEIVLEDKIFPNAVGHGTLSRGAYAGATDPEILIVDTLDPGTFSTGANRGTFMWAVKEPYPRIVVFEVSGVIDYSETDWRVQVEEPYLNIYGQTSPGKGVTIKGAVFWLQSHDILVQHLKLRPGDHDQGIDPNEIDALNFYHGAHDVVVDHCSLSWSVDELVGSKDTNENITFSNCIFGEPLDKSWHHDDGMPERHSYACLMYAGNTTFYRNLFAYTFGRNPLIRQGSNHVINNLNYTCLHSGTMIENIGFEIQAAVVGNHIINVGFDGVLTTAGQHAVYLVDQQDPASRLYVEDNRCGLSIDDPSLSDWEVVYNNDLITQAQTPTVDLSEFDILPSTEVEGHVLAHAGAFFWNRDAADQNIIDKVQTRAAGPMRHSVYDYPATARNVETTATTGDVSGGYDWSADPQTLVLSYTESPSGPIVGPVTVQLTDNCGDITAVVDHINSMLPAALECSQMNEAVGLNLVEIHTTHDGDGAYIQVHPDSTGASTLGIVPGEFFGYSYVGYDTESDVTSLSLPQNPHQDPDGNSYTNLEEWAWILGLGLNP